MQRKIRPCGQLVPSHKEGKLPTKMLDHKACLPLSHKFGPLLTEKASAAIAHVIANSAH
jgi:hypothetical protein